VAGGNKQRDYISKEDASSPTVATEAVLLLCIINAMEGRDVAVINIPNAFIQMRVEDEGDMAIITIRGVLMDILVQIAPDVYKSYCTSRLIRKGQNNYWYSARMPIWYNGGKPTVLSQIHQESDECRI
jgi:hypothetical protein